MNTSTITTRLLVILLPTKPIPIESAAVAEYSVIDTVSLTPFSSDTTPTDVSGILHHATSPHDESHVFAYSVVTLGVLAVISVAMFMVGFFSFSFKIFIAIYGASVNMCRKECHYLFIYFILFKNSTYT